MIREAVETVRPALQAKGIHFREFFDRSTEIVADPDRVRQIVWNLLFNAIKFTPPGGTVQLRVVRAGASVVIEVIDSGAGISADFLPHVFERFRQAEGGTRRRHSGLGLGLAIVRQLAELHGGSVAAESEGEGRGAAFRVTLPAGARPSAPAAAVPADDASPRGPIRPGRLDGTRVLVVDDEADARDLFASVLEAAGASVSTAASVADALPLIRAERDLVLVSDIEMPGQDGYELLQHARADLRGNGRRLLAVAVTAYARPADRERALAAGYAVHLAKPVDPGELVATLADLLAARGNAAGPSEAST